MVEFTREELDAFLSKTDFDFSQKSDWEEFLAERKAGGTGRDADGLQLRDIKNYAVGASSVITTGGPVTATFTVRSLGSGLALAPGNLFVFYPDANWEMQVRTFYVGPPGSHITYRLEVGGSGTSSEPDWGNIYYIMVKASDLPGQGAAEALGRRTLRQSLRAGSWLLRRGFGLLRFGGAGYDLWVQVGGGPMDRNTYMEQEILSDEARDALLETAEEAWDYLSD